MVLPAVARAFDASRNVRHCSQAFSHSAEVGGQLPGNSTVGAIKMRAGGIGARQGDLLQTHALLETNDLDRAREFVNGVWERHTSVMRRGRTYGLRWNEASLVNTTLSFLQTPSRIHVECAPVSDCYRLTMHEKGGLTHRINGYETVSTTTQAVVHSPGQELRIETEPFRTLLLTFDGAFVRKALIDRFGRVPPSETLAREVSLTSLAGASLRSLCRWMAVELDRPGRGSLGSPLAVGNMEGTLLTLFLECLITPQGVPKRQVEEVAEARVARVEDWIDAHLGEPIRVDTLAQVASASVRALENAFRRYRGCTPMEAVTHRRLIHARQALQFGVPGTTVTSAAIDAGFFHLGRFAARYRDAFGEPPSSTLREPPPAKPPRD